MANEKKFIATVEADAEAVIEKITAVVKRGVFWWHKKPYTTGTVLSGLPKQEVQHLVDAGHLAVVDPAAAPAQVVVSAAPAAPAAIASSATDTGAGAPGAGGSSSQS